MQEFGAYRSLAWLKNGFQLFTPTFSIQDAATTRSQKATENPYWTYSCLIAPKGPDSW
jgi:hypothetical protein